MEKAPKASGETISGLSTEAQLQIYQKFGDLYSLVSKLEMTPELGQCLCRLTEAGMWFRMNMEMDVVPKIDGEMHVRDNKEIVNGNLASDRNH